MSSKIVDQIMQLPAQEWFGNDVIHDLSMLEFSNPLEFEDLSDDVNLLIDFIGHRCLLTEECIQGKIAQLANLTEIES